MPHRVPGMSFTLSCAARVFPKHSMALRSNNEKSPGIQRNPRDSPLDSVNLSLQGHRMDRKKHPRLDAKASTKFPGDKVDLGGVPTRLGNGIVQEQGGQVIATRYGALKQSSGNRVWIDNYQKRYVASVGDWVVGVITEKHGDNYRLDIGEDQPARLPSLSFEGATKRNKPNLEVGSLMYCTVVMANKHMETELSCISPYVKKEWVTGEGLFGPLKDGYVFKCSLRLARRLMQAKCHVLKALGELLKFELAIGLNGQVWVNSGSEMETVLICNAIKNSEFMSESEIDKMVGILVRHAASQ
ncbi:hypothetical protein AAMO2058_001051600 [Amorphochlora amoebiformis]